MEWKMFGLSITSDFEPALMKAVTEQFVGAAKVFCFFHFKKAIKDHCKNECKIDKLAVRKLPLC
jgi:hypothetical protein